MNIAKVAWPGFARRAPPRSMFSPRDVFDVALCLRHPLLPLSPINCVLTRPQPSRAFSHATRRDEREERKKETAISHLLVPRCREPAARPTLPPRTALSKDLSSAPAPRTIAYRSRRLLLFFYIYDIFARANDDGKNIGR